jgi:sugar/nucleoside kinase (ribokinase family)
VTEPRDHDAALVVPDYTIWSQINVDEVVLWGDPGPRVQLGGAATYAALGARIVSPPERSVRVVGSVGADFEPEFWQWFEARGIETSGLEVRGEQTSRSKLVYGRDGERVEYPVLGQEHFRQHSLDVAAVPRVSLGCRGLYVFREAERDFWDELLAVTSASGAKVLWEIDRTSCDPRCWADDLAVMKDVDVFSINHAEATSLLDCDDALKCLDTLRSGFDGVVLYRMGENGSYVVEGASVLRVSAVTGTEVVDPTGAGNAYGGGFLAEWCEGAGLEQASRLAAGVAGLVLGEWGPPSARGRDLAFEARELARSADVEVVT